MSRKIKLTGCHFGLYRNTDILPVSAISSIVNMLRYSLHICNPDGHSQMNLNASPTTTYCIWPLLPSPICQYILLAMTLTQITTANQDLPLPIHSFPQFVRAFKSHDPSRSQHQIFPGLRVPPSTFPFFFHIEFSKSGDHDILARRQGGLYGLKDGFNKVCGLGFLDVEVVVDSIYKMIFCEGHGSVLLCIRGFLGDFSIVQ